MTIKEQIMAICKHENLSMTKLALKMGVAQQNFNKRVNAGKFAKEERKYIASVLGCEYISYFEFADGHKVDCADIKEQIELAAEYVGMSIFELSKELGYSTKHNFLNRMTTGRFLEEELIQITSIIGCKYVSYFEFPDGYKVGYDTVIEVEEKEKSGNKTSRARLEATKRYEEKTYTKKLLRLRKEEAKEIDEYLEKTGQSFTGFTRDVLMNAIKNKK